MEVFMQNLPFNADRFDLLAAISNVVHGPTYVRYNPNGVPLNFEVSLHNPKRHRSHLASYRTGAVTFPTREVGERFLLDCGGANPPFKITLGQPRTITFSESRNPPKSHILENITHLPFVDPLLLKREEEMLRTMQESYVSIMTVQFGWECRDGVFSVEWEKGAAEQGGQHFQLQFEGEDRQMRICLGPSGPDYQEEVVVEEVIVILFSQIRSICVGPVSRNPVIYLNLRHPPSYELQRVKSATEVNILGTIINLQDLPEYEPKRLRICSLSDKHHALIAPYTSISIRLLCSTKHDLNTFHSLWKTAQIHHNPLVNDIPVERRDLFSSYVLSELDAWFEQLEWPVAFHADSLVRNMSLDPRELLTLRPQIREMLDQEGQAYTGEFLWCFRDELNKSFFVAESQTLESAQECYERLLKDFKYTKPKTNQKPAEDLFNCLHVDVTPSSIFLDGPFPERTNRVIRSYIENADHFLRVSFQDENGLQFRFDHNVDGQSLVEKRVGEVLRQGLRIGGKHFQFLAYSQSALKDHAVWFVSPFRDSRTPSTIIDAATIIKSIGSFENLLFDKNLIYCPARYAARLSQAFTTTDASISIEPEEIFTEPDIKRNDSCFTDGVGTMSASLAQEIYQSLRAKGRRGLDNRRPSPRAIQIRFQGSKGMVSVDYKLTGRVLVLRPSMIKFEAPDSNVIDIAGFFNKPGRMYLNRPLIILLEGLGVDADVFLRLQREAVARIKHAIQSLAATAGMLDGYGLGTSFKLTGSLLRLSNLHCTPKDPFYRQVLQLSVFHVLRDLKYKARILVPGWTLVGVADIHSYLEEGQVFVCIEEIRGQRKYLTGPVSISRSPTIHPGDVQMAYAIGAPPEDSPFFQEPLQNTIVFSTKGSRSLPSKLGGGDLDGDTYNVTDFTDIHPQKIQPGAAYNNPMRKMLNRPSTMDDVVEFVVDYINNDNVGIIATTWMIIADQSILGIMDPNCMKLSQLHSDAVDYPKSGTPVPRLSIPRLKFKAKPDWSQLEVVKRGTRIYKSKKALGILYRDIKLSDIYVAGLVARELDPGETRECRAGRSRSVSSRASDDDSDEEDHVWDEEFRRVIRTTVSEYIYSLNVNEERKKALEASFREYVIKLRRICVNCSLSGRGLTEVEAVVGTIKARCAQPKKRKDSISRLREQTAQLVTDVLYDLSGRDEFSDRKHLRMAFNAWELSLRKSAEFGAMSFGWIALTAIFDAINKLEKDVRRVWVNTMVYPESR